MGDFQIAYGSAALAHGIDRGHGKCIRLQPSWSWKASSTVDINRVLVLKMLRYWSSKKQILSVSECTGQASTCLEVRDLQANLEIVHRL